MKYIKEYNNYLVEKSKNDPIPEIYNDKLCIILLGAPGVGKSTFINNYILTKNKNIKVFSTDDISLILTKDPNIYDERSSDMNIRKLEMYIERER
jgi:predicted kinase